MFTDIAGYSALSQQNEALALELLDEHFRLLRPLIPKHQGTEIKTIGDAFMASFASPLNAVRCALAMQKVLGIHNASAEMQHQIKLRIGIHLGDVEHRAGDLFGDGVNIASRIEPLAEPGGICISQQVYDHVYGKLDTALVSIGKPPLKNIQTPVEVYKVVLPWQPASATSPAASAPDRKSIAVLPFANMSADAENEYFSDGLTEDIIAHLSKIGELKVISRTSVMQYKKTTKHLRQIGQELGVATLLEGSVRKAGNRVRVVAQLINAGTDEHVWAETYDRELTDIFAIQSDIAQQIAGALHAHVSPAVKAAFAHKPTENLRAYELCLLGRWHAHKVSSSALKQSIEYYERALELDPLCAKAYAGLVDAYIGLGSWGFIPPQEGYDKAIGYADKALQLDQTLPETYVALGFIQIVFQWDWVKAEGDFLRALELNPNYADAHRVYAWYLKCLARFDEALAQAKLAEDLDPRSLTPGIPIGGVTSTGTVLFFARRFDEAEAEMRRRLEFESNSPLSHMLLGWVYLMKGSHERALEAFQKERDLGELPEVSDWGTAMVYARQGKREEARKILNALTTSELFVKGASYQLAMLSLFLGDEDGAFAWLEKAYEFKDAGLPWLKIDPTFDQLRQDPRFIRMLQKIGLAS